MLKACGVQVAYFLDYGGQYTFSSNLKRSIVGFLAKRHVRAHQQWPSDSKHWGQGVAACQDAFTQLVDVLVGAISLQRAFDIATSLHAWADVTLETAHNCCDNDSS
jgi:hypothetical protein